MLLAQTYPVALAHTVQMIKKLWHQGNLSISFNLFSFTLYLQDHGIQIEIGTGHRSIEGTISLALADNLGSNSIGGFMESFSATRPCRFCMGALDAFQTKVSM